MRSIFLSYRRDDTAGQARALYQELTAKLGRDAVFMDVDSIALGRDFREVLQERLSTCDFLLALIGKDWLNSEDENGKRRIDDPADFVRLEITAALQRNIAVIPVLLEGTTMPRADDLPEDLKALTFRNGFELSHTRWDSDVAELIKRLGLTSQDGLGSHVRNPNGRFAAFAVIAAVVLTAAYWYFQGADDLTTTSREVPSHELPPHGIPSDKTVSESKSSPNNETRLNNAPYANEASNVSAEGRVRDLDLRLRVDRANRFVRKSFVIEPLDLQSDFRLRFTVRSLRQGGSTRYGIAWNYSPDDFQLFTLHSAQGGYFSIGTGKSRSLTPFSRFAEGQVLINGERAADILEIAKRGNVLSFAINDQPVWRTTDYRLTSNQFAFWAGDTSEALLSSYQVEQ